MLEERPVRRQFGPAHESHDVGRHAAEHMTRLEHVHGDQIAAEREEQAVPERQDPRVAPDQIEREGEQREGRDLSDDVGEIG